MKSKRLTIDEHRAVANKLHSMKNAALDVQRLLRGKYPKSYPLIRHSQKIWDTISDLRCDMDSRMALEHPDQFDPSFYYSHATKGDNE